MKKINFAFSFSLLFVLTIVFCFTSCSKDDDTENEDGGGKYKGHEYVDLGLPSGTYWATCNIGSSNITGFGNYFAWGETSTKSDYSYETYKWCSDWDVFTKYVIDGDDGGTIDNRTTLEESDDAAHVAWGGKWKTPTYDQWNELISYCTIKETEENGVNGERFIGPNGSSIFIPEAGYRYDADKKSGYYYWTSSMKPGSRNQVYYYNGDGDMDHGRAERYYGHTVRAVIGK